MAYDEGLAQRVREMLAAERGVSKKRMFGGVAVLLDGNMAVGVVGVDLMVRVGPDAYERLVAAPRARKMDFTGRPMKGFVYVSSSGLATDADLRRWIGHGAAYARSLPGKQVPRTCRTERPWRLESAGTGRSTTATRWL